MDMLKRFQWRTFGVSVLCLLLVLVAACSSGGKLEKGGNSDTGASASQSAAPTESASLEDETVELTFWSWVPLPEEWEQEVYPKFQEKHPNIKIQYTRNVKSEYEQKLRVAIQAGEAPDSMGLQLGAFVHQYESVLEPLGPYAEKSLGSDWLNQFKEAPMTRASEYDYKALPTGIVTTPYLLYDADMFAQAGIDQSSRPLTQN